MKSATLCALDISGSVTPHVGVWIEIDASCSWQQYYAVTPHVGVWIEIE